MRGLIIIASLLAAAAAEAQPPVLPGPPAERPAAPEIVTTDLALATSTAAGQTGIEVQSWDTAGPAIGDSLGARVDYFTVTPATLRLSLGQSFPLSGLEIQTHGLNGNTVERARLKLTLEAPAGLIDVDLALADQRLLATSRGIGRLWIESLLPRGTGTGEHYRLPVVIVVD